MPNKLKVAVSLLNYWNTVEKSLALKTIKKLPSSSKIAFEKPEELNDPKAASAVIKVLQKYIKSHFLENITAQADTIASLKDRVAVDAKLKNKSGLVKIELPQMPSEFYTNLIRVLDVKDQHPGLKEVAQTFQKCIAVNSTENKAFLQKDILCPHPDYFENIEELYEGMQQQLRHIGLFISAVDLMISTLPDDAKKSIAKGDICLLFKEVEIIDNIVTKAEMVLDETEEQKKFRIIKERALALVRARRKKVESVDVSDKEVVYAFSDPNTPSLKVQLDVVTGW